VAGKLKNIKINVPEVVVLSTQPAQVLVHWSIEKTAQDLRNFRFFIERGESPTEFQLLTPMTPAAGIRSNMILEFVDSTANLVDLHKVYYYRVRGVEFIGGQEAQSFYSDPVTWDGNLDLVGLYIVEEHLFFHRYVAGVPVMIFKKRRDGAQCPDCWDDVLHRVTKSNCTTCYGTGKLAGFYPPYEAWMNFEPDPKAVAVVEWGQRQSSQTDIQFTNYPLLTDGDIIVELKPNKIWKVSNVRYPEKNRTTILQIARLDAVYQSDVEYRVPVSEDRRRALLAELDQRDKEREF